MTEYLLEWKNVNYSIRQGFWLRPKNIISNLTLAVPKGRVLGLIGPNGAGKTTAIKLGAGLIKPDNGEVLVDGNSTLTPHSDIQVGLLTENQYIYRHLRFIEWLEMLGTLSGLSGIALKSRIKTVLEMVELEEQGGQLMKTLSKGQLQRAGIAQAFLHEPDILLLDEPMSGLDPSWRQKIHSILLDYNKKGGTVVFSSHILSDVLRLSDTIAILKSGKIQWSGNLSDLHDRKKGVQAVIQTDRLQEVKQKLQCTSVEKQTDGSFLITMDTSQKKQLLLLEHSDLLSIETLSPLYSEIEEIFNGKKTKTN